MKLRVMNCKNCGAPLHLVGEKLVCEFCSGVFDIEKDRSDIAYDNIVNAEEMIRRSLVDKKAEMQEYYRAQEEKMIEAERLREEKEKQERLARKRKARKELLRSFIIVTVLLVGCVFLIKFMKDKYNKDNVKPTTTQSAPTSAKKSARVYRVVPSQLEGDKEFMDQVEELAIDYLHKEHEGAVIESSQDIWKMIQEPELVDKYLVTSDRSNNIYLVYKFTLETDDGRTKEAYNCVATPTIYAETDGSMHFYDEDRVNLWIETSSEYEFFWHSDFDKDKLYDDIIRAKIKDEDHNYLVYDLAK